MDARDRDQDSYAVAAAAPRQPAHVAAIGGIEEPGHAGIAVLGNRALFELVTDFLPGYPFAVIKLYNNGDVHMRLKRTHRRVPRLWRGGVLLHLAIEANDAEMLALLYRLSKRPQYQQDVKLRLDSVMRYAVLYSRVEMLECIKSLKGRDPGWEWEYDLMRVAIHRQDPDLRVLEWLSTHVPRERCRVLGDDLRFHVERGDLDTVKWLRAHGCKITQRLVNAAASCGHAHVLRYLYEHSAKRCASTAVSLAVQHGHVDVLQLIFAMQREGDMRHSALLTAAQHGKLGIVKLVVESKPGLIRSSAFEWAAWDGHLDVIKYLHEHFVGECSDRVMTNAAAHGHLEIVEFLHEHRTESCSPLALERAACNGHLQVVKFLHEKYGFKCSREALSEAASKRHWDVVEFHERNCMAE